MTRIIGVNTNCYHGFTVEKALEGIHAAGFRYVELTATKGWTEHVFPDQTFESLCHIRDMMAAMGLIPFAMSGHVNLMDANRLKDFRLNMQLADFFGCHYIVSSIGEAHIDDKKVSGTEALVENIRSLIPDLHKHGLELVLELHGEHSTGSIMREIVEKVNSELVGINYDTANCIFYGHVDPVNDIDSCIEKVRYMHIKDKAGKTREWNFPSLGQGTVNFPALLKKLDKAGNNCPLSVEIEFTEKGPANLEEVNKALKDSASYLMSLGMAL